MTSFDVNGNPIDDDTDDLPKQLRKQIAEKDKALKELSEKFEAVAKRDRERTLKDIFTEKGIPAKAAKFFPADVEATPETVMSWATENADVFGLKLADQPPAGESAPPALDAYARLQQITQPNAVATGEAEMLHKINNASEAELLALVYGQGGGPV